MKNNLTKILSMLAVLLVFNSCKLSISTTNSASHSTNTSNDQSISSITSEGSNTSVVSSTSATSLSSNTINTTTSTTSFEEQNEKFKFELIDSKNGYRLISYIGNETDVVVPNQYKGLPVLEIKEGAFNGCGNIERITLPFIGASAQENNNEKNLFGYIFGTTAYENGTMIEQAYLLNESPSKYECYIPKNLYEVVISYDAININDFAFSGCRFLTSIEIPYSIISIGIGAFAYCDYLTSIVIPNSVTSIGSSAFCGCSSLTSITIPNSVTSINMGTFSECYNLTSVIFESRSKLASIGEIAFVYCRSLTTIVIPNSVTSIGKEAFAYCDSLTSIEIPDSVTSIEGRAFQGCSSLIIYCEVNNKPSGWDNNWNYSNNPVYWGVTQEDIIYQDELQYLIINGKAIVIGSDLKVINVVIPETIRVKGLTYNVTSIGKIAFSNCKSLTSIVIPNSVTSIGKKAFSNCKSLTSIVIPNSVTSIGEGIFLHCDSLKSLTLPYLDIYLGYYFGPILIGSNVFYIPSSLEEIIITGGSNIPNEAFKGCNLISIEIPNSVTSIGEGAFKGCESLTTIVIPNSVTSIGKEAFAYCDSLTSIEIPNSVTSIGERTFDDCRSLTSIEIPNSITSIGNYAFYGCNKLTSVTFEEESKLTSIGDDAFYRCGSLDKVYYEGTIEDWCRIKFSSSDSNPMYYAKHFYMLNENNEYEEVTEIVIPNTVTSIGDYQFYGFSNVTSIVVPNSVTSIGNSAFSGCGSLENVYYKGTIEDWCRIKFSGFSSNPMSYAKHFYMLNENNEYKEVTEIVIPNTITSIGDYQFYGFSNVTSIVIPNSVSSIGIGAFYGCSSLSIYCEANSQPSGWDAGWNLYYWGETQENVLEFCPVYWSDEWSYIDGVPTANS